MNVIQVQRNKRRESGWENETKAGREQLESVNIDTVRVQ